MNTSKNISVVFLGNLLASFIFASGLSLFWAIDGGYEALGFIAFIGFIILGPLLVGTISFSIIFGHITESNTEKSAELELFALITHLVSLLVTLVITNRIHINGGSVSLFLIWLGLHIVLSICLKWIYSKFTKSLNLKNYIFAIFIILLIITSTIAYYAEYLSRKNKTNELPLPTISCNMDTDCSILECKGHRFYCDATGFPVCRSNVCSCSFGCL